jgi:hypothetical protein
MAKTIELAQALDLTELIETDLKPEVRRLAAALAEKPPDPQTCTTVLQLADQLDLEKITDAIVSREVPRILAGPISGKENRNLVWCLLWRSDLCSRPETIAFVLNALHAPRRGDPEDRVRAIRWLFDMGRYDLAGELEPLLNDTGRLTKARPGLSPYLPADKLGEVRDVALGVLVLWSGQHPAAFGFPQFTPETELESVAWTELMFGDDDKARAAALARWRAYQAERKARRTPQDDSPEAALLRRLGSDDWVEREEAAERLRRLGVRAEALLKTGLDHADPEVVARCRQLLNTSGEAAAVTPRPRRR